MLLKNFYKLLFPIFSSTKVVRILEVSKMKLLTMIRQYMSLGLAKYCRFLGSEFQVNFILSSCCSRKKKILSSVSEALE